MSSGRFSFDGATDIGKRGNNEDAFLQKRLSPGWYVLAVADGMGGGVAGEVASATVLRALEAALSSRATSSSGSGDLKQILEFGFHEAQLAAKAAMENDPGLEGMGTTLTVLLVHETDYVWGNIGDSRIYRLNEEKIGQITRDHSHIQDLIDKGENPDAEYIRKHSNIITRCIAGSIEQPDLFPESSPYDTLSPGTGFILCSDGLITHKPEEEIRGDIHRIFLESRTLESACSRLIEYALAEGARDNITVIAAEYGRMTRIRPSYRGRANLEKNVGRFTRRQKNTGSRLHQIPLRKWILYGIISLAGIAGILLVTKLSFEKREGTVEEVPPAEGILPTWEDPLSPDGYPNVTRKNDMIYWNPFPDSNSLQKILVIWEDSDANQIDTIVDSDNTGTTALGTFRPDPFDENGGSGEIYLRIEAWMDEDSIVHGNTAKVEIRK